MAGTLRDRTLAALPGVVWAVAVGAGAVVGSYVAVGGSTDLVVAPVANGVVALTPAVLVTFAITVLGDAGSKLALAGGIAAGVAVFAAVAGAVRVAVDRSGEPTWVAAPVAAAAAAGAGYLLVLDPTSALAAGCGALFAAGTHAVAGRTGADEAETRDDRRSALAALAGLAALGVAGLGRAVAPATSAAGSTGSDGSPGADGSDEAAADPAVRALLDEATAKSLDVAGLEPLVSTDFYTVDIANVDPDPAAEDWTLRVTGAVSEEVEFTYDDVTAMDQEHRFVSLRCVGESLNGKKLDNALWTGVPIADLLSETTLEGEYVMLRADDGFYEEFPVDALRTGFLAVGMNGRPLPRAHGAPARALIPGHWGEINVKWLTEIEILEREADGYWEERGWHGTGPVNTVAKLWAKNRLDDDRVEVAGAAYAGTRGIDRVEVSTDGGETWTDATLSDPLPGEDVWRQWVHRYEANGPHEVVVRATDGTGTLQPRERRDAFPSGATGWVSERVDPERL